MTKNLAGLSLAFVFVTTQFSFAGAGAESSSPHGYGEANVEITDMHDEAVPATTETRTGSAGGQILALRGGDGCARELIRLNADGSNLSRYRIRELCITSLDQSPTGNRVVFAANTQSGANGLYSARPDLTNTVLRLQPSRLANENSFYSPRFAPDGERVAFGCDGGASVIGICTRRLDGAGAVTRIAREVRAAAVDWSPAGERLIWGNAWVAAFDYGY